MKGFLKKLLISVSIFSLVWVFVILCISPIVKYLVEKYDERFTGRQITMDLPYVNPFTGYIRFNQLKIYEFKSEQVFFSARCLSINIAMLKLFSKTCEISELIIDEPYGAITKNDKRFNFQDLIEKFSSPKKSASSAKPFHFNIRDVKIKSGEFHYVEQLLSINYFIKEVNVESTGKQWDADTISAQFSFLPGSGNGSINGSFTINAKNKDYRFAVVSHKFDLNIIEQYLKDITNYGSFSANLDADIKATGNFNDQENITASGRLAINEFHFGKNVKEDYASFNQLAVVITELSPLNHKYLFDSISLTKPRFKYERYDYLDNLQTMFGARGSNIKTAEDNAEKFNLVIEITRYIKVLAKNFLHSDYKINRLRIYTGGLKFNDFSISEKFTVELNPLFVTADSIDKNHKRVKITLNSGILPYGNLYTTLSINPKDSSDFDLGYSFQKIPVSMFNPYIISYTSFPFNRGTIELKGEWNVRNGMIRSNNHLAIIDPRVTKRLKNKGTQWVPVPLIMTFVRERGNVIDYEIPITGNLNNPQFHLRDVIFDLLENIFVKPATFPYRMEIRTIETEIERSLTVKWRMSSSVLLKGQEKFINRLAGFLRQNPEANISIYPQLYEAKEKEYIVFFEAKKKYFQLTKRRSDLNLSKSDSVLVSKMSVKDSLFTLYLGKKVKDPMLFTVQDKCKALVGSDLINAKYNKLQNERERVFLSYFKESGVEKQVKIKAIRSSVPYNGFSFYRVSYTGDLPQLLKEAYRQMNEFNEEAPRKKFKKQRLKIKV